MATSRLSQVIQTLRRESLPRPGTLLTDGQLLDAYLRSREEGAFADLVQRHGPMVWGVCRRVLRGHHDTEDAFQATFLVLVRKATSIVPKDMVANWLYGVAHQTALKARARAAKRSTREKQVMIMPEAAAKPREPWDALQPVLDQELSRLPDKYRAVIVLCDLEGKTRKEAAVHFRVPEGTVASRLATARALLAKRLTRAGLAVTGVTLAAALTPDAATAAVPATVASSTIKAATLFAAGQAAAAGGISIQAVSLAEGVLKTMLLTKLKSSMLVLLTALVLTTGAAAITHQVMAERPAAFALPDRPQPEQPPVLAEVPEPQPAAQQKEQAGPPAKEARPADPIPTNISGIVKAVNAANATLTVTHREGETIFNVAKDAQIEIDGKRGELAALPAGAIVNLRQFTDATTTRSVDAQGRWLAGVLKAVDTANDTITFDDNGHQGAAGKTFNVPKGFFVSIDGKVGKLAGVPVGAIVNLQLRADQTTVRSLSAEGAQINGVVKAIDVPNRTIKVNDATYPIAQDVQVGVDHKPGKLEDVPAGCNVSLNLRVDQKTVLRISANGNSDFGQVKAVDTANNTITVTGGPPNDRVYHVPPDAPISIDNKPGTLAAIPVGAGLHALNLRVDQKTVSSINVVGPSLHRVEVKSVDAERRTLTFDEKAPMPVAAKSVVVAPNANIEIDGKAGKLADIPAGASLNIGLSVDGTTALHVQAEGPTLGGCGGCEISAVDATNFTVTFSDKGLPEVSGKTFRIAKDVWLQMDAQPGRLADLPTGSYLNITLTVDQQLVRSIWAVGPPVPGIGVVQAVDAEKRTITVDNQTYPVARNANIVIENRGGLDAVPIGANVTLRLCVDQKTVGTVAVQAK